MTPEQANGFVIWDDSDSAVKYWELVVIERSPLTDSTYIDVRVWRQEEWRNNYAFIPKQYRPLDTLNKYGVYLYGKNASHETIAEEGVIPFYDCVGCGGEWWFPFVYIDCNGPDYAWRVRQYLKVNGWGHKYTLTGASYNGEPYYEYMTTPVYNALIDNDQSGFLTYYAINNSIFLIAENSTFENMYVKTIVNSDNVNYKDKYGNVIYASHFKAVRKASGPWNNAVSINPWTPVFATDPLSGLHLNYDLIYAMALMNSSNVYPLVNNPPEYPTLQCNGQGYTAPGSETSWEEGWTYCDHLYSDELYDFTDSTSIAQFLDDWHDCIEPIDPVEGDNGSGGNNTNLPWGNVLEFSVSHVNNDGVTEVFNQKSGEFYNESGEFRPFSFTLNPGLHYMYAILDQETDVIPDLFFEITEPITIGITYAHMFNFTAFPVPHIDDQFSINMQAAVNLRANYELFDFQGNRIHRANYNLMQGHNEDHLIVPANPIPTGLLVHRFTFEDGSVKTLTTMRQ